MRTIPIYEVIGDTDIYLLDQIMKDRYKQSDIVLDAGCGMGRNLHWFLHNNRRIWGIDKNPDFIKALKASHAHLPPDTFQIAAVEDIPFQPDYFHHVVCSAVLHFANSTAHFEAMMAELVRVLKPNGSLFIRMTSDIGIETRVELINDGVYRIPDLSTRFLLTRTLLASTMQQHNLSFVEPLKTVNVNDVRCMSTIVLIKN